MVWGCVGKRNVIMSKLDDSSALCHGLMLGVQSVGKVRRDETDEGI